MADAITLKELVAKQPVELMNDEDTLTLVHSILDVLESGVEKITLKVSDRGDRVVVDDNCFKSISCDNVQVAKISDKGQYDSKADAKACISASSWHFPCPDYKYSNIKRNLERCISAISGIREVEVKSFMTGIVEYDEAAE